MKRLIVWCLIFCGLAFSQTVTFTIAQSGTASAAVDLKACTMARLHMPSAWDTANLEVQLSTDGITYKTAYDSYGNKVTITAAADREIILSAGDWWGVRWMKLVATAAQTTAAREILAICK